VDAISQLNSFVSEQDPSNNDLL
jgi:hypothetical protein